MHRAFREGRQVFIGKPANHFPLVEDARHSLLFAGGIGVTPLIAMAHRLHAIGKPFALHYSAASRAGAGFVADLAMVPWAAHVRLHFKDEGGRADLPSLVPRHQAGDHLYTCGAPRYMDSVFEAATAQGWPEEALHREYFSVPEAPAWLNLPFTLQLSRSGRTLQVPAERSATEVLADAGIHLLVKCSDGLCGTCATAYDAAASGAIEHRDFVLSAQERERRIILCCSRARSAGARIVLDL